jgi:hypothetical protein
MALTILSMTVLLLIPVAVGWRIAFNQLRDDPSPSVKWWFWIMSALLIGLAAVAFVATRFI